jgi:hypothetical protein
MGWPDLLCRSGTAVYVHSDRKFQNYLMMASLSHGLAPENSYMEIPLGLTSGG